MVLAQRLLLALGCMPAAPWFTFATESRSGVLSTLVEGWAFLLTGLGLAWLIAPHWRRLAGLQAWAGITGLVLSPLSIWPYSLVDSAVLFACAVIAMLIAGYGSTLRAELPVGLKAPKPGILLAIKVLLDELVLAYFVATLRFPKGTQRERVLDECRQALTAMGSKGWLDNLHAMHPAPRVPTCYSLDAVPHKTRPYQRLQFDNPLPDLGLPGSDAWHTTPVQARLFEHAEGPRPWLMCIHGYRMGWLPIDFQLFPPGWLHHKLGFNLVMPILPLHGQRKQGWLSGDGLFDGDIMRMVHAITQGIYDLRCILAWLRDEKQAEDIAVLGYSLGGFHAAMLASLESRLNSVIPAIPLVDLPSIIWEHAPRGMIRSLEDGGLQRESLQRLLSPLSPLALEPQTETSRLAVTAARSDRLVPAAPIVDLLQHWQQPACYWFNGSHLSVRQESRVRDCLLQSWEQAGLLTQSMKAQPQAG